MKEIIVIEDTSGSMSVLGKKTITQSLMNTIRLSKELYDCYADLEYKNVKWDGKSKVNLAGKDAIILTDGYCDFSLLENIGAKTAIVLCGLDSSNPRKGLAVKVFSAQDILEALEYVIN